MNQGNNPSPGNSGGFSPLGGPVGNPDGLIDLTAYRPPPLQSPEDLIRRAMNVGVLPTNIGSEMTNPIIRRAAIVYLARHDDVVSPREFEGRFTPMVIESARLCRSEDFAEGAPLVDSALREVVRRALDLLDGGFISPAEAEEAITWPHHLPVIEQRANTRLIDPHSASGDGEAAP